MNCQMRGNALRKNSVSVPLFLLMEKGSESKLALCGSSLKRPEICVELENAPKC